MKPPELPTGNTLKLRAAALEYAASGIAIFPCAPKKKTPFLSSAAGGKGFNDATSDPEKIAAWWNETPNANIGLVPGMSGLLVIDVDGPEGEASLKALGLDSIPTRSARSGRPEGGRHLYFRHPGGTIGNKALAPKLDLRADAGYVVVPPSVHPSGGRYTWTNDAPIADLPESICAMLTEGVVPGGRNNAIASHLGKLRREGATEDDLLTAALDYNQKNCNPPLDDAEVTRIAKSIAKYAPEVEDELTAVEELNGRFAVVQAGDKVRVLQENQDGISLLPREEFCALFGNRFVRSRGRLTTLGRAWLAHTSRRQYDRIVFEPGGTKTPNAYNLWRGWAVEPNAGDCSLFHDHLLKNVCSDNGAHYEWLFAWFANIVRDPMNKPGTAVVLRGRQGTGKTLLGQIVGELLGPSYALVASSERVTGKFNVHLERCLLLQADEAFWAGDKAGEGSLKDLVTNKHRWIERKGIDQIQVANCTRLLVTSNSEWVVPAGPEERRFAVFDVSDARMQDKVYFKALIDQLEHGGYEALLYEFLHRPVPPSVDLRTIPETLALFEQKLSSLTPEQAWWLDILERGTLPGDKDGDGRTEKSRLYDSYIAHAQRTGARRRQIETTVGIFLKKNVPNLETVMDVPHSNAQNPVPFFEFPTLEKSRAAFSTAIRRPTEWGLPSEWQGDNAAGGGGSDTDEI